MAAELRVVMTGEEAKLFNAIQKIVNKTDDSTEAFKKNQRAASEAEKEAVRLAKAAEKQARDGVRFANQLEKKNETLEESYKRRKMAIEAAGRAGKKSAQEVELALDQLESAHAEEKNAAVRAEEEKRQAILRGTDAYRKQDAEVNRGVQTVQRLQNQNRTLKVQYEEMRRDVVAAFQAGRISMDQMRSSMKGISAEYRQLRSGQSGAFGQGAIQQIKTYVASWASITTGIQLATRAVEFFKEQEDKATGSTDSLVDLRRSLRQISKGDFDRLEQRSDRLASDDTLGITREQARQLVFDARSTGFEREERTVARADPVINIEDGAAFAGEFRKFFGGEGLSIEQAFNTALAGAAESQFNISRLLPQVRTGAQGQLRGGQSSDLVAAVSVLADNFGRSTGDRIRALGVKASTDERIDSANLIDVVKQLQRDEVLRKDFLGDSSELNAVFAKFSERLATIQAADRRIERQQRIQGDRSLINQAIAESRDGSESGRIERARRASIAAEQRELIQLERNRSADAFSARDTVAELSANRISRGDNRLQQFAGNLGVTTARRLGVTDRTSLEAADETVGTTFTNPIPRQIFGLLQSWRRESQAADQLERIDRRLAEMQQRQNNEPLSNPRRDQ